MSQDIRNILERITAVESDITPVGVRKGLNTQQKKVPQLPAEFHPQKISVLGSNKDPKHPMTGMAVGANEGVDELGRALVKNLAGNFGSSGHTTLSQSWPQNGPGRLAEVMANVEEDMLSRMRHDLRSYLDQLDQKKPDDGRREPEKHLRDLQQDTKTDTGLISKAKQKVQQGTEESTVVETMAMPDGRLITIRGEPGGKFCVHRGSQVLGTNFKKLDHARMAVELYRGYCRDRDQGNDYVQEK